MWHSSAEVVAVSTDEQAEELTARFRRDACAKCYLCFPEYEKDNFERRFQKTWRILQNAGLNKAQELVQVELIHEAIENGSPIIGRWV